MITFLKLLNKKNSVTEIVESKYRNAVNTFYQCIFSLGYLIETAVGYRSRHWKSLMVKFYKIISKTKNLSFTTIFNKKYFYYFLIYKITSTITFIFINQCALVLVNYILMKVTKLSATYKRFV